MGVPTSEVGYTLATTRRETTKVHKNMWWHWGEKNIVQVPRPINKLSVFITFDWPNVISVSPAF